jgi:hypothetical protein
MKRWYALHRWLAAIAFVQLGIWTISGFFFAISPLAEVRGEDRKTERPPEVLPWAKIVPLASEARQGSHQVRLIFVDRQPVYWVESARGQRLFDATTSRPFAIDAERARRIALADQRGVKGVRSISRIEVAPLEYRGKPLPAWCVELEDDRDTRIYIDASSGRVTARRNELWRWFDFFWSLHIMDYGERTDFNHPLLIGFAGLGILTVLSGGLLWLLRLWRRWKRRRRPAEA